MSCAHLAWTNFRNKFRVATITPPKEIEQRTAPKNEALNSTRHVPTGRSTNSRMTETVGIMSIIIPQKVHQH